MAGLFRRLDYDGAGRVATYTSAGTPSPTRGTSIAAVTQIRNDTAGHAYFDRKVDEDKTRQEASAL